MAIRAFLRRWRAGGDEPDVDHPAPVELDLGHRMSWEVDALVARLVADGHRLRLVEHPPPTLGLLATAGGRSRYRVLVAEADADAVRRALEDAGVL